MCLRGGSVLKHCTQTAEMHIFRDIAILGEIVQNSVKKQTWYFWSIVLSSSFFRELSLFYSFLQSYLIRSFLATCVLTEVFSNEKVGKKSLQRDFDASEKGKSFSFLTTMSGCCVFKSGKSRFLRRKTFVKMNQMSNWANFFKALNFCTSKMLKAK